MSAPAERRRVPFPAAEIGVRAVRGKRAVVGAPVSLDEVGRAGDVGSCAHYADPPYFTKAYADRVEDVAWYVALARRSRGPVLEYGIGNGRIAIPTARAGVEVFGIDLSLPMLADLSARLRAEPAEVRRRVRWRHGDMRRARLRRRFPLVIAPFNVVLHLYEREDVERFFARVREHLAPRGRFAFDFSVPSPADLAADPDDARGGAPIRHPTLVRRTRYRERFDYDPLRQILMTSLEYAPEGGEPFAVPLVQRQFFPQEMEALLHYNGLEPVEWTADFGGRAPDRDADSLVVIARAARAR